MKVYLSATKRTKAREATLLIGTVWGYEVVSRWLDRGKPKWGDREGWAMAAVENFAELGKADVVVALPAYRGEGVQVECGYALALGKPVVILGKRVPSSLLWHPAVRMAATVDELEAELVVLAESLKPR